MNLFTKVAAIGASVCLTLSSLGQGANPNNVAAVTNIAPSAPTVPGLSVPSVYPTVYLTNLPLPSAGSMLALGTNTIYLTNAACRICPGYGFGLWADVSTFQATNLFPITFNLTLSPDGTNYATYTNLTASVSMSGSNEFTFYTNFPATVCDGAAGVKVNSVTFAITANQTNVALINAVKLSHHMIPAAH